MSIYEDLGIRRVINCYDTLTYLGGSVMPDEVIRAMMEASKWFVNMHALHERVGAELARLTHNDAAYVCGGAAAGLALAAAACIAGDDPVLMGRLPDTSGMRNEIVVQKCQRNPYDHAVRQVGAKLVEIDSPTRPSAKQLRAAINDRTAAVFYVLGTKYEVNALPLKQVIQVADEAGVPVFVDAAAQLPPVENLWRYTNMGAKMVIFSGGKAIRGPQSSGLIVGDKDYIRKCAANSCPNHSIGRSMKASKEDIVGLYTAVKRYVSLDHEAELQLREKMVARVLEAVQGIAGVTGQRSFPARLGQTYPRAIITLSESFGARRDEIIGELRNGDPVIELGPHELDPRSVYVNPLTLTPDDAEIVATRLREVLLAHAR